MRNRGSLFAGILLVVLGVIFLLAQMTQGMRPFGVRLGWSAFWPFLVIFVGLAFWLPLGIWWEKRHQIAGLVVPGTIVLANGLLLLYQNTTNTWRSWSYAWALEPVAVGLGLLALYGLLRPRPKGLLVAAGIVGGIGIFFFLVFATAFGEGAIRLLVPLVIIGAGAVILLRGVLHQRRDDDRL